jgi:hypothetical protein
MYSRRALLAGLGAGGATLLAGCAGSATPVEPDEETGEDSASSGGSSPQTLAPAFQGKLLGRDTGDWAYFGSGVALSADGRTAVVGSEGFVAENVPGGGRVFVFERTGDGWTETATLDPSDGQLRFGRAVALSADGQVAVVGAPFDDALGYYTGSVSVFERGGDEWIRQAVLYASDADRDEYFGSALSLSADGSALLVSAPGKELNGGQFKGNGVYLFERDGDEWRQVTKVASVAVDPGLFGWQVALSADGTTAFVAAPREPGPSETETDPVYGVGAVYVYDRGDDGESTELRPAGMLRPTDDVRGFGHTLSPSADGRTLLLGVSRHLDTAAGSAEVFVREEDGWSRRASLGSAGDSESEWFAGAVSLSDAGDLAVVRDLAPDPVPGTPLRRDGGFHPPVVHVLRRAGADWERVATVTPSDPEPVGFEFVRAGGTAWLSADGSTVLFAAPGQEAFSGAAFVYGIAG